MTGGGKLHVLHQFSQVMLQLLDASIQSLHLHQFDIRRTCIDTSRTVGYQRVQSLILCGL